MCYRCIRRTDTMTMDLTLRIYPNTFGTAKSRRRSSNNEYYRSFGQTRDWIGSMIPKLCGLQKQEKSNQCGGTVCNLQIACSRTAILQEVDKISWNNWFQIQFIWPMCSQLCGQWKTAYCPIPYWWHHVITHQPKSQWWFSPMGPVNLWGL